MKRFIIAAHEIPPHTTTLPEVVNEGEITLDQWRAGYGNEETPCFKRAVEEILGGKICYQQGRVIGGDTHAVRRLTFFPCVIMEQ